MLPSSTVTRRDGLTLLLLLVLAAAVRWGDLGRVTQFAYDEGDLSLMALDVVHDHDVPLLGIRSSVGVRNSPVTVYVLAAFYMLSSSPLVVTGLIALFNVFGVGIWWAILRRTFTARIAALSTLLYALSPYAIHYSRKIWAQDYHTPLILAGVWLGIRGFYDGKRWAQVACLPVLVIGMQIHFAAWTLLPLWVILVLSGRQRADWWAVAASMLLAGMTLLPFALGMLGVPGTDGLMSRVDVAREAVRNGVVLRADPFQHILTLLVGTGVAWGNRADQVVIEAQLPDYTWLWYLLACLAVPGMVALWRRVRPAMRGMAWLVMAWLVVPVVVFVPDLSVSQVYRSYYIPLLPVLTLLVGLGADAVFRALPARRWLRGAFIASVGLIALTGAWWYSEMLCVVDTIGLHKAQNALPLHYLLDIRDELRRDQDIVLVDPQHVYHPYEVWKTLLYASAACVREISPADGMTLIPAGAFTTILAPATALDSPLVAQYMAAPDLEFPLRQGEGSFLIQRHALDFAAAWDETLSYSSTPLATFENGTQLLTLSTESSPAQVTVVWGLPGPQRLDRNVDIGGLRFYIHALNAEGQRVAQRDVVFWPDYFWCAGDRLVYQVAMELPEDVVQLYVGQYVLSETETLDAVNVVGADGAIIAGGFSFPVK